MSVKSRAGSPLRTISSASSPQQLPDDESPPDAGGCLSFLLRITWMMWGNFALFACAAVVAHGIAPLTTDVLFLSIAIGVVAVRYLDIMRFGGETADGEPATFAHWRRYAIAMASISFAVWVLAKTSASRGWL